ncbi:MAG: hypothetical protein V3V08_23335 [Nannocystaceae bacterium]
MADPVTPRTGNPVIFGGAFGPDFDAPEHSRQRFTPQARGPLAAADIPILVEFGKFRKFLSSSNPGLGVPPGTQFADFTRVGALVTESAAGGADIFPGESGAPADLPFVIQSGDIFSVEDFEAQFGPISELTVSGTATTPGGEDRTVAQEAEQRLAISRGGLPGGVQTQAAFRSRVGRGRGSTILGGLGDEEKTTILGG